MTEMGYLLFRMINCFQTSLSIIYLRMFPTNIKQCYYVILGRQSKRQILTQQLFKNTDILTIMDTLSVKAIVTIKKYLKKYLLSITEQSYVTSILKSISNSAPIKIVMTHGHRLLNRIQYYY